MLSRSSAGAKSWRLAEYHYMKREAIVGLPDKGMPKKDVKLWKYVRLDAYASIHHVKMEFQVVKIRHLFWVQNDSVQQDLTIGLKVSSDTYFWRRKPILWWRLASLLTSCNGIGVHMVIINLRKFSNYVLLNNFMGPSQWSTIMTPLKNCTVMSPLTSQPQNAIRISNKILELVKFTFVPWFMAGMDVYFFSNPASFAKQLLYWA